MPAAAIPANEAERLAALRSYDVLDTACEAAFDNIAELAAQLTGSPMSLVSLVDADRQWFKARVGLDVAETPRNQAFCAHAILEPGMALVVEDAATDPRFADNPLVTGALNLRFYAGVPLINAEGAALGTLCVLDQQPRQMSEAQRKILHRLAETVMTTLELRRAMARAHKFAMLDSLTGLPNRPALLDGLERAIARQVRSGGTLMLLYLDLDGFKQVNDRLGHAEGDAVLRAVADALKAGTRHEDLVTRIGGDEFAIVMEDCANGEAAAERVRTGVGDAMAEMGRAVSASIGAAAFAMPPADVVTAVAAADALMYEAKVQGKNRVAYRQIRPSPVPLPHGIARSAVAS